MNCIIVINAGSSSVKYSLFERENINDQISFGVASNIDQSSALLEMHSSDNSDHPLRQSISSEQAGFESILSLIMTKLDQQFTDLQIDIVGYRIVHGGPSHTSPEIISPALLSDLEHVAPLSPKHLPAQISIIRLMTERLPASHHVACFDTAFHQSLPETVKMLPIPRSYYEKGVRKYGFHGLSLESIVENMKANWRIPERAIVAHIGSGVSLTALLDGKSIDTTMGLSPNSGVMMSTRSGDVDPGLLAYLSASEDLSPNQIDHLLSSQSGLLGISEKTPDMERLLALEDSHEPSKQAIDIFCYNISKQIGAYAAALNGFDALVFAGGIGEVAAEIRSRICNKLSFLDLELDNEKNISNQPVISANNSSIEVRIVKTDENRVIAKHCQETVANEGAER